MKPLFLIDTDTASDDAVALIMALRSPDIRVLAITIVAGNVSARVTMAAFPGPLFVIVIAKVTNPPALTLAGELIVIPMSVPSGAIGVTAVEGDDSELLPVELVACTVKV